MGYRRWKLPSEETRFRSLPGETLRGASIVEPIPHDGGVELRVPLGRDDALMCWFSARYCADDPLVVHFTIDAPSSAVVLERLMPRSDFRTSFGSWIRYAEFALGPGSLDGVTFAEFHEEQVTVEAVVPTAKMRAFLRATDRLLPQDKECDALSRTMAELRGPTALTPQD
ncbi:MAG TPA: hypothetical protein VM600_03200 [Actinomycetota bacterium]|nr:hypothetical protein [Actinomycetota bacterium]